MKCNDCLDVLDEYVAGDLDRLVAIQAAAHFSACAACASRHDQLQREQRIYSGYLLNVKARPELWDGLHRKIEQRKMARRANHWTHYYDSFSGSWNWQRLSYAGGLAGLALTITLVLFSNSDTGHNTDDSFRQREMRASSQVDPVQPARRPLSDRDAAPLLAAMNDRTQRMAVRRGNSVRSRREIGSKRRLVPGEQSYVQAIAELTELIEKKNTAAPPLRAAYQRSLAAVDDAIAETRLAARTYPADPRMAQFVLAAYRGKLGLLTAMVEKSRGLNAEF